jgi:hypothetical protein
LKILGNKQKRAKRHTYPQRVHHHRRAKHGQSKKLEIDQGISQHALPLHENNPEHKPDHDTQRRNNAYAFLRNLLHAEDHQQHRAQRQRRACEIKSARLRIAVFGQQPRSKHQQQCHHRHAQQKD